MKAGRGRRGERKRADLQQLGNGVSALILQAVDVAVRAEVHVHVVILPVGVRDRGHALTDFVQRIELTEVTLELALLREDVFVTDNTLMRDAGVFVMQLAKGHGLRRCAVRG